MSKIPTFKHSGNLGDIIYALPTIIALGGGVLYVATRDHPPIISAKAPQPFPLSSLAVAQLSVFLKDQPCLKDVRPYSGEVIDYDLDRFREYVLDDRALWKVHLAKWHLKTFHVQFDLSYPWLFNITANYVNDIVVTYSVKNATHSDSFDWPVLKTYQERCVFLGYADEYYEFTKATGLTIKFYQVESISQLAQVIKGSKLLISNQSFGFALAEAMKHPRILDVLRLRSNSLPQSANGYINLNDKIINKYLVGKHSWSLPGFVNRWIAKKRNIEYHKNAEGNAVIDS